MQRSAILTSLDEVGFAKFQDESGETYNLRYFQVEKSVAKEINVGDKVLLEYRVESTRALWWATRFLSAS